MYMHKVHLLSWSRYLSLHEPGHPQLIRAMTNNGFDVKLHYHTYVFKTCISMLYGKQASHNIGVYMCEHTDTDAMDIFHPLNLLLVLMSEADTRICSHAAATTCDDWIPAHDVSPAWLLLQFIQDLLTH